MRPTLLTLLLLAAPAWADGERFSRPLLPAYAQDCGSCHLAYPPALLPAPSWQRLMQNLPRHFGSDASLDPATRQTLQDWLQREAGRGSPPPEDRISRSPWFVREHREVAPATWARPSIRSAAQCNACHGAAAQGDFSEHRVRIPR